MTHDLSADAERFVLLDRRTDHPDAARLLQAFYDEQVDRYGFADPVDLDPHAYTPPNGTFLVAYARGWPVGCCGCHWYDRGTGTVEIKKAYLVPSVRGRGLGRALLARLEAWATVAGARRVILETGVRNIAALTLFAGSGYEPTARYVADRDPRINRAFEKLLTPVSQPPAEDPAQASVR